MLELRRRVQLDPASIAFAQLAEECRRLGSNEEAVSICRAGLAGNPGYLSARVTLGRALIELGQLDAAKTELDIVVAGVPDNLAAIRGLAEILQRRGQMTEALKYYKRALELAKHDPDLEDTVERISQAVTPAPLPAAGPQVSIEEIFNFDTLINQLGLPPEAPETPAMAAAPTAAFEDFFAEAPPSILESVELRADDTDSLAVMERELRELEEQRAQDEQRAQAALAMQRELEEQRAQDEQRALAELEAQRAQDELRALAALAQRAHDEQRARKELTRRRRDAMVAGLEAWLSAIQDDRQRPNA